MNLATVLYLVDFIHNLDGIIGIVILFYLLALIPLLFMWLAVEDDPRDSKFSLLQTYKKFILNKAWVLITAIFLSVVIPTEKTMYLMLGSVYLSKSNLPAKVSQALELKLDDVIKELKKKNK